MSTIKCKQCKKFKPIEDYGAPQGFKISICFDCGSENMAKWARTNLVGVDVDGSRKG